MIQAAERLNSIHEYYFSKKLAEIEELNRTGKNVINLGIGSPDMPPHPGVIKTLQEESAKANTHAYQSYRGSAVLRTAIAAWYKKWYDVNLNPADEVLPLIGSKEGIVHICMAFLGEGDKALVPNPGYPAYKAAVELAGAAVMEYELKEENDYLPNLEAIAAKDLKQVKILFVNYPHMPTGKIASRKNFEKLLEFAQKHHILIVHDNPYSFILNDHPESILSAPGAMDVAIELNSLSKSHNMAGWRVGMVCGKKEFLNEILRFKSNMDSGMFLPVQLAAARALLLGNEWHDEVNSVYRKRKKKATELLDLLRCRYDAEQAGLFVWAKIPSDRKDGFALSDEVLYKANVFITPGGIFGSAGNEYVRISLCSTEEKIEEAIERIKMNLT